VLGSCGLGIFNVVCNARSMRKHTEDVHTIPRLIQPRNYARFTEALTRHETGRRLRRYRLAFRERHFEMVVAKPWWSLQDDAPNFSAAGAGGESESFRLQRRLIGYRCGGSRRNLGLESWTGEGCVMTRGESTHTTELEDV
jgi:hypothetical protein